ncbi:MAG: hypothetical protein HC853_11045, partial [Anaerolineae bacterium]|nr:hypothetical protein [Anaerolineae bacterium]
MVMIDPKMVELTRFAGLPHIIGKPESEMDRIPAVLRWVTKEMDDRYKKFAQIGSRNLAEYNESMKKRDEEPLPRIVLMIDELADLMMQSPIETEKTLCRLAQMARATGIHMVVATQRPSVDVVTGLIKANFPARIAFAVARHSCDERHPDPKVLHLFRLTPEVEDRLDALLVERLHLGDGDRLARAAGRVADRRPSSLPRFRAFRARAVLGAGPGHCNRFIPSGTPFALLGILFVVLVFAVLAVVLGIVLVAVADVAHSIAVSIHEHLQFGRVDQ